MNRVVLVTGGTKGIGRSIAQAFLAAGDSVVICARSEPDSMPEDNGRCARFHACDVRDAGACKALVDSIVDTEGRIDVLVNNAGGSPPVEAATVSPRFSEAVIALNLTGPLHLSQAAHAWMIEQPEGGSIVNIASVAGVRPAPGTAAYGAAKAGLLNLSRSLAQEWAPKVRVNSIVAGLMHTEQTKLSYGSEEAQAEIAASVPMGRMGLGADIAKAVLFLSSPDAGFVTGATLEVHGGGELPLFADIVRRHTVNKE